MITETTTLNELAAIVSDVLEREGIVATLLSRFILAVTLHLALFGRFDFLSRLSSLPVETFDLIGKNDTLDV